MSVSVRTTTTKRRPSSAIRTARRPQLALTTMLSAGPCLAAAAAARAAFQQDLRAASERLAGHSRLVETGSGPMDVAETGAGPPALVVHGAAGGFDMGLRVGTDVLGDGFRILAPSRFGYLRTPMPNDSSHDAQADAFASLLDALQVPSATVIAVSAGAQSVTRLALRHPHRVHALVLIAPALYLPPDPGLLKSAPPAFIFDTLLASDLLVWSLDRLAPNLLVRAAGVPGPLLGQVTPQDREKIRGWFFAAGLRQPGLGHDIRTTTPTAPDLPIERLRMPVMFVSAGDDPYKTADVVRYSAPRVPNSTVLICDSGGHVLLNQTDRVRHAVRGFLAESAGQVSA